MIDPYSVIQMPWITEKTLEARRISDGDDPRLTTGWSSSSGENQQSLRSRLLSNLS